MKIDNIVVRCQITTFLGEPIGDEISFPMSISEAEAELGAPMINAKFKILSRDMTKKLGAEYKKRTVYANR